MVPIRKKQNMEDITTNSYGFITPRAPSTTIAQYGGSPVEASQGSEFERGLLAGMALAAGYAMGRADAMNGPNAALGAGNVYRDMPLNGSARYNGSFASPSSTYNAGAKAMYKSATPADGAAPLGMPPGIESTYDRWATDIFDAYTSTKDPANDVPLAYHSFFQNNPARNKYKAI